MRSRWRGGDLPGNEASAPTPTEGRECITPKHPRGWMFPCPRTASRDASVEVSSLRRPAWRRRRVADPELGLEHRPLFVGSVPRSTRVGKGMATGGQLLEPETLGVAKAFQRRVIVGPAIVDNYHEEREGRGHQE
jgi:hypothetical protein